MLKEFREFLMRGNVLDMAVGIVIGAAFTAIITSVVKGVITPLVGLIVAALTGGKSLDEATSILDWTPVKGVTFAFGDVVTAIITFIITGFILFIVVRTANKHRKTAAAANPNAAMEAYLSEIRDLLKK